MEVFETLKAKLVSPPLLALPYRDGKMYVDTDAPIANLNAS